MPTFTTVALDNLLAPDVTRPTIQEGSMSTSQNGFTPKRVKKNSISAERRPLQHLFFSPTLYTTPEQNPIPDSPSSFFASPYVLDYKRRRPRLQTDDGLVRRIEGPANYGGELVLGESASKEEAGPEVLRRCDDGGTDDLWRNVEISVEEAGETGNFSDSRLSDVVIGRREEMEDDDGRTPYCPSEFFDASEEFWQGSPFFHSGLQAELDSLRMDLLLEIERRKKAEEAVEHMHVQWERIAKQLSQVGLSLPMINKSGNSIQESEDTEVLSCEVAIARFVAEAIGRGEARAEAEATAEALINSKNVEIARLHDKLQYYETVNHEITRRNLENLEVSRRLRQRRKMTKRLVWSCVGLSVSMGACFLTYSCLPRAGTKPLAATTSSSNAGASKPESMSKS